MHPVQSVLSQLEIGTPKSYKGLSIFPLKSESKASISYLLLGEAVAGGLVSVRESSYGGSVPSLLVENRAQWPVLVIDGEELLGAKQNRVANLTMLIAAGRRTEIPVSCVEAGRWSYRSDEFEPSKRVHFARGRRQKLASVQASMRETGSRHSDQAAVWDSIEAKAVAMDACSPTSAMSSIFEKHAASLDEFVNRLRVASDQSGGVFAIGGEICGLDLFDKPTTFTALLPKLVGSYGIDALEHGSNGSAVPDKLAVSAFLAQLSNGNLQEHAAVGMGFDFRIEAPAIVAGGLVVDSHMIHLAAFAESPRASSSTTGTRRRFANYRQRRSSARRRS